ncbi:unnamed protein product [Calicophoron daubneyi]|uniref:Calmodulin-lysine N-methyltransferase n=1 Tax=Calicophoron daubneyi TaxID=300641 RepID=A0AAV2TFP0_CALDB
MAGSTPSSAARIRWKTLATALRTGVVDLRDSDCGVLPDTKAAKDISAMLFGRSELLIPLQQNDPPVKWLELVPLRPKWDENTDQMTAANYPHVRVYTSLSDLVSGDNTQGDKLAILSGFDNTGNVFIWPCELILGHSFFYPELYPGLYRIFDRIFQPGSVKRVCELGAGMTGLGGLSAAVSGVCLHPALNPSLVVLTDGNQRCVDSLCAIRDHQRARYRENSNGLCAPVQLEVEKLVWPQDAEAPLEMTDSQFCTKYDLIIAADCFFDTRGHIGLLRLIDALLPNSKIPSAFIAIAPQRGGTLQSFIHTVQSSGGWTVDSVLPEEFISEELWTSLLRALPHLTREFVLDKVIGHLFVVQRIQDDSDS